MSQTVFDAEKEKNNRLAHKSVGQELIFLLLSPSASDAHTYKQRWPREMECVHSNI